MTIVPNKQSGFTAIDMILVVVLLAAIGALGYFAYQQYQASPDSPGISLLPVAMKTYTDPDGVFSFKYPANWTVSTQPSEIGPGYTLPVAENLEVDVNPPHVEGTVVDMNVFDANPSLADFEKSDVQNGSKDINMTINSKSAFFDRQDIGGVDTYYYFIGSNTHIVSVQMTATTNGSDHVDNLSYSHQFSRIARSIQILK